MAESKPFGVFDEEDELLPVEVPVDTLFKQNPYQNADFAATDDDDDVTLEFFDAHSPPPTVFRFMVVH